MTAAMTGRPVRRRAGAQDESAAHPVIAGTASDSPAEAEGPTRADADTHAASPARPEPATRQTSEAALWACAAERLVSVLAGWITAECRATVDRLLSGIQPNARGALLPSEATRATLANELLSHLPRAAIAGMLSPGIEAERRLLLRMVGSADPMLREASLDSLGGVPRQEIALQGMRETCRIQLAPAFALLGAGAERDAADPVAEPVAAPASPADNEAALTAAMRRNDLGAVTRMLASHAGVAPDKVGQAVWTRDARSLFGLAWRAGYSMRAARLLQIRLAGIPPDAAIGPGANGVAPMGRCEVAWQMELLASF